MYTVHSRPLSLINYIIEKYKETITDHHKNNVIASLSSFETSFHYKESHNIDFRRDLGIFSDITIEIGSNAKSSFEVNAISSGWEFVLIA